MRPINLIVVHCSSSDNPKDDSPEQIKKLHTGNIKTPAIWGKYHINCFGWSDIGYHYIITKDGQIQTGRPIERPGSHAKGYNSTSIGVCLTGEKEFTELQFQSLRKLSKELILKHKLSIIDIVPHNKLNKGKACPNFDLDQALRGKDATDTL